MTPSQIQYLETSFTRVAAIKDQAAALFYARLFELDPSLRPLFKSEIAAQGQKLMAAIGMVIANLRHPERVVAACRELGRRHTGYGVKAHHYDTVGAALLWTLERGLGSEFSVEVRDAWTQAYGLVSGAMISAANDMEPLAVAS
ncbi:MAG: hemin receptor [Proteobacteria bacterium]|nr:hemin receptor [Pseudomonadota bacterium]